jgi:hypothetical protein
MLSSHSLCEYVHISDALQALTKKNTVHGDGGVELGLKQGGFERLGNSGPPKLSRPWTFLAILLVDLLPKSASTIAEHMAVGGPPRYASPPCSATAVDGGISLFNTKGSNILWRSVLIEDPKIPIATM